MAGFGENLSSKLKYIPAKVELLVFVVFQQISQIIILVIPLWITATVRHKSERKHKRRTTHARLVLKFAGSD